MNYWQIYGIYFGFPTCCIQEFNERMTVLARAPKDRKLKGTGFVPCKHCTLKSEAELIAEINSERLCPTPFPCLDIASDHDENEVTQLVLNKLNARSIHNA